MQHAMDQVTVPLEVWGGIECTVNRVGDNYFDQLERNGHALRDSDLELIARLGISAIRYPVLWERTAPDGPSSADWRWSDRRLVSLRDLGVRPIVGLVHHGSGPRHLSLVDPRFADELARYACAVAERYPWVEEYTPVNEPLTTARFSALYGLWYPHHRSDASFARALLEQCRGIVLSMRAIRTVNPRARLVQTEDLGKVYSTPRLGYQAAFENHRRWLTYDLLSGRVNTRHPLWGYLVRTCGVPPHELHWFIENACAPDVLGVNYYVTSERYLDQEIERYPAHVVGGNGYERYADVAAVRVRDIAGPRALMEEAWRRYRRPIAVTEAHLGCTREHQLRWLDQIWRAATELRSTGAEIRAVTAWSLLGSFDWNSLLTRDDGVYESGVFDVRSSEPRPTALATMIESIATRGTYEHPTLDAPGWWQTAERILYRKPEAPAIVSARDDRSRPILVTGATGTLGNAMRRICRERGLKAVALDRAQLDIGDVESVRRAIREHRPWGIVNAAGYVRVDDAERERDACFRTNAHGPAALAEACAIDDVRLVTYSSDLVFDGRRRTPYVESDRVVPLGVYGASKAEAERRTLEVLPRALVVRTSAFIGPWDEYNFLTRTLRMLHAGLDVIVPKDQIVSPTYVPDLVHATLDLLIDGEVGVWHLANVGSTTWGDLARTAAERAGVDANGVIESSSHDLGLVAPRPSYSVLGSERASIMPSLDDAIGRYLNECDLKLMLMSDRARHKVRRRTAQRIET